MDAAFSCPLSSDVFLLKLISFKAYRNENYVRYIFTNLNNVDIFRLVDVLSKDRPVRLQMTSVI